LRSAGFESLGYMIVNCEICGFITDEDIGELSKGSTLKIKTEETSHWWKLSVMQAGLKTVAPGIQPLPRQPPPLLRL